MQSDPDYMTRFLDSINDSTTRGVLDSLCMELATRHEAVFQLLQRMDANGDGVLSRSEIRSGLLDLRIALTSSELDSVMRLFDKHGNGSIDYHEFYHVIQNHRVDRRASSQVTLTGRRAFAFASHLASNCWTC